MHHIHIDQVNHIDCPVVTIGNIYPDGHSIVPHHHRPDHFDNSHRHVGDAATARHVVTQYS